jgi:tetratricopeptide (TPR) repeat protein
VRKSFLATGKPYAQDAIRGVTQLLNDYAAKWAGLYRDACEATHVRGEQSEEVLDLRMGCLNERLSNLRALTDVFATATDEVVEHGVEAAHALTSLDGCSDIKQLKSLIQPPDPGAKARVEALRRELGQIKAVHDAGRYVNALNRLTPIVDEARSLKYRPLEAEALARMGTAEAELGRMADAEKTLDEALRVAIASRHDDLLPEISSWQVWVLGYERRAPDAERWKQLASATIERVGATNSVAYAWLLNNIGAMYQIQERYAESLEYYERARAIKEKELGTDDPDFAASLGNIALTLSKLGRHEEALRMNDRCLRIYRRAMGDQHPRVANELHNRGEILSADGKYAEALAAYEAAKRILEREFGPDSALVAYTLTGIGESLVDLDRPREAVPLLERALDIRERSDRDNARLGETEFALARATHGAHPQQSSQYLALARRALDHYRAASTSSKSLEEVDAWLKRHDASKAIETASN